MNLESRAGSAPHATEQQTNNTNRKCGRKTSKSCPLNGRFGCAAKIDRDPRHRFPPPRVRCRGLLHRVPKPYAASSGNVMWLHRCAYSFARDVISSVVLGLDRPSRTPTDLLKGAEHVLDAQLLRRATAGRSRRTGRRPRPLGSAPGHARSAGWTITRSRPRPAGDPTPWRRRRMLLTGADPLNA